MLILALGSVLVGCIFLVISFLTENTGWAWGCIVACGVAAIVLLVDTVRRNRASVETAATAVAADQPTVTRTSTAQTSTPAQASTATAPVAEPSADDAPTTAVAAVPAEHASEEPAETKAGWRARRTAAKQERAARDEEARVAAAARAKQARDRAAVEAEQREKDAAAEALLGATAVQPAVTAADLQAHDDLRTDREPDEEDVDAADILVVGSLREEVLVIDEHPRFHLGSCSWLRDQPTLGLPVAEAMELGFTGCARCAPSRVLAAQARER
ncbi:hypothetical protein [Rhodococcus sp. X156]|uniref:hypothetical protein n=1 Tax=Rhodococcus sp. X156 TaxID=2499145 RepID=UPI000FD8280F|nr:hypothetical protein [Rhodococcus sp. X156]